jgi:xanthine/CO dehydrogenase XdhC/CoxF family maturation factor
MPSRHELGQILSRAEAMSAAGEPAVLATLVRLRGSHYRKPGARMLLGGGELAGMVSGGCLEGELGERAAEVLAGGRPVALVYDLTRDDDALWGFGLGCAGEVTLLLEPLGPGRTPPLGGVAHCLERRRRLAMATLFESPADGPPLGSRWWRDGAGEEGGDLAAGLARTALAGPLAEVLAGGAAREVTAPDGGWTALVEPLEPPASLVVAGAGRDAVPVARLAGLLGWEVTVVDLQGGAGTAERFAGVDSVLGPPAGGLGNRLRLNPRAAAIVMTHRYLDDVALLAELLPLPFGYLALLGPRARRERLLADLERRGIATAGAARSRIRNPAGLDLGGGTPEEIALAIVAEAQAVLSGREGGPLTAVAEREAGAAAPAPALETATA